MDTSLIQSQQKTGMYLLHLKYSFMIMLLGFYFLWSYLRELYFNVTNIVKIMYKVTEILSN